MTLKELIIPMVWVGTNHPYWYVHPIVTTTSESGYTPATWCVDALLKEMYCLKNPTNQLRDELLEIDEADPETWYNHLHLIEIPNETAC